MSKHLFNLSCPRCETVVKVYKKKTEYSCSRCHFRIFLNDARNLIEKFTEGQLPDLEMRETVVNEFIDGVRREGLSLTFQEKTPEPEAVDSTTPVPEAQSSPDEDDDDFKSAHTQVINLSFDPTQVLEDYANKQSNKPQQDSNRHMSLRRAIANAAHARAEVSNTNRYILIGCIIALFFIVLATLILGS